MIDELAARRAKKKNDEVVARAFASFIAKLDALDVEALAYVPPEHINCRCVATFDSARDLGKKPNSATVVVRNLATPRIGKVLSDAAAAMRPRLELVP